MLKCILTVGIPASSKSTWAKKEVSKDPLSWVRINNDELRQMCNSSVYSSEYEKIITDLRNYLIRDGLKKGKNIIIDNLNLNKRHWETVCKIAKSANVDVEVFEKHFYVELEEAIERDSKREGSAKVGPQIITKWWKESGKTLFKFYNPKKEIFIKNSEIKIWQPMIQDESLERVAVFDNDGTVCLMGNRSPYDASECDILDFPHKHVIECLKLYYNSGYKILFVSGREEKDRAPTERFYQKYFPEIKYELFMRPTSDSRADVLIKEEIFNTHIKDKYFVAGWFDDRLQVSKWIYESGLPLFRVNNPEASF